MEEIIEMLKALKEDKQIIIDDDLIKNYIEENINLIIEEIKQEV